MNLRDLRYLLAVADTRHFGKAADRCFVSQPTLSAQIRKLEEQLGVEVFERTKRSVTITAAGEPILEHARRAIAEVEAMEETAQAHRDPLAGTLRIGAIPTISPYLLPRALKPLRSRYPHLDLALSEDVTATLERRLREHDLDVAVLATAVKEEGMTEIPLYDEPFWLIHPREDALRHKTNITRADLKKANILLLSEVHCMSDQVMDICRIGQQAQSDSALQGLRAFSLETLIQLVAAGYGCTLLPALAVSADHLAASGVVAREIAVANASRRIRLVYRSSFPRAAAIRALAGVFAEHLPDTVKRLPGAVPPG